MELIRFGRQAKETRMLIDLSTHLAWLDAENAPTRTVEGVRYSDWFN